MDQSDWEKAAGVTCPRCHQEVWQLNYDGICRRCEGEEIVQEDKDHKKQQKWLAFVKAHNERVDRRSKKGAR